MGSRGSVTDYQLPNMFLGGEMVKAYTELLRHSGNQNLFRAIEMSVLANEVNRPLHIHAEGLLGTGKTTVMRAARDFLPLLSVFAVAAIIVIPCLRTALNIFFLLKTKFRLLASSKFRCRFWKSPIPLK